MSNLFMDMHRRRCRSHSHENTSPTSVSASATTATTTSESPSSTQHVNDHTFSHHNKSYTPNQADADRNANYTFNNRKGGRNDKHDVNTDDAANEDEDDVFENVLSLKLRKPKHWKWELSTSKSYSNIALPRILLYDHKGQLLVDALGDNEGVYTQQHYEHAKADKSQKRSHQSNRQKQRSATTNLTHSIRKALENDFNGLSIQEATPSPERYQPTSNISHHSRKAIDMNTTDLPDKGHSTRSSSLRGVRFIVEETETQPFNDSHIPEFLPTPPSTTTATSSSSGPREKRKYRRSQSSGRSSVHSGSILERFSYQKGRCSSPEYAEDAEIQQSPRYFLRTCNAGTLVVKEDSFIQHPKRRRRPPRNRSSESLQSATKTPPTGRECPISSVIFCNRKHKKIKRHLSDANILLNKQLSTSDEEYAPIMGNVCRSHLPKYPQTHNQTTDLKYSTDVHENAKVR